MSALEPEGPSLLADLDVVPKVRSTNRGLARRLMDGALRPPEREDLARVEEIRRLEEEGLKGTEIAQALHWSEQRFRGWCATDKYRLLRRYVAERQAITDDGQLDQRNRQERRKWEGFGAKALRYFDQAFREHPRDDKKRGIRAGDYVDLDRAERAAKMIAGARGWLEPVAAASKAPTFAPSVIQATMDAIRATDRRELVVRVETKTIEVRASDGGEGLP